MPVGRTSARRPRESFSTCRPATDHDRACAACPDRATSIQELLWMKTDPCPRHDGAWPAGPHRTGTTRVPLSGPVANSCTFLLSVGVQASFRPVIRKLQPINDIPQSDRQRSSNDSQNAFRPLYRSAASALHFRFGFVCEQSSTYCSRAERMAFAHFAYSHVSANVPDSPGAGGSGGTEFESPPRPQPTARQNAISAVPAMQRRIPKLPNWTPQRNAIHHPGSSYSTLRAHLPPTCHRAAPTVHIRVCGRDLTTMAHRKQGGNHPRPDLFTSRLRYPGHSRSHARS